MTNSGVLVSIILPFHIYDNYLDDAIESVIGQSFESWELLLIDNSISKNNIKNIKNNLIKDSRVRLISFLTSLVRLAQGIADLNKQRGDI